MKKHSPLIIEIALHLAFWLIVSWYWFQNADIRPWITLKNEAIILIIILLLVYFAFFLSTNKWFRGIKQIVFWGITTLLVLCSAVIELRLGNETILACYNNHLDEATLKLVYRGVFFLILLRNFCFVIFFYFVRLYKNADKAYKQEKRLLKLEKEHSALLVEKEHIQSQYYAQKLSPHYLLNVLNSVQTKVMSKDEKAAEILQLLYKMMDYYVVDSMKEKVTLEQEIAFYENYRDLEALTHDDNLLVTFQFATIPETLQIIPLVFEPLLGNAFKFTPRDGTGIVKATIESSNNHTIIFTCENNINKNIDLEKKKKTGVGLHNLRNRLWLHYFEKHTLTCQIVDDMHIAKLIINN